MHDACEWNLNLFGLKWCVKDPAARLYVSVNGNDLGIIAVQTEGEKHSAVHEAFSSVLTVESECPINVSDILFY